MSKKGYTITKSNYTLKIPHSNISSGTVYERDFMATNNLGGWNSGSIPNSENSFKMVSRSVDTAKRQHYFGDYLLNDNGTTGWTLENGAVKEKISDESKIVLKTDNTTLLSYAYYGSCTQLVQSSIRKIINNFPAEMYSTEEKMPKDVFTTTDSCPYIFNNDFEIDIITKSLEKEEEATVNPLRYMYLSHSRFKIEINDVGCGCCTKWSCEDTYGKGGQCEYDKEITMISGTKTIKIRRYILNKKAIYLTNTAKVRIKLTETDIEAFFDSLDDFQKLLLNRNSNPLYTAKLDFPHETENGIETYQKTFTWPLSNDFNLDIKSRVYEAYVNSLLDLASFYDEYNTDNLWKNMVHDSIKNMDITFSRKGSDEDKEDYNEGTTKIEGLLWAYGRFFDEIKRYIDNVRNTNAVTYNGEGNLPDYFLTDTLNLNGWEISSAVKGIDSEEKVSGDLFPGKSQEYTANDANVIFLKNLKLNSKNILSKKGTRRGIEEMLGLFGFFSDDFKGEGNGDYTIEEKIYTAKAKGEGTHVLATEELSAETYNMYKGDISTNGAEGDEYDTLEKLPAVLFYYYKNDKLMKTIIPWFKGSENLDANPYFQMYGGWGKIREKYTETIGYLNIVDKIIDLSNVPTTKLPKNDNNIIFVTDIADIKDYFPEIEIPEKEEDKYHYFILEDKEKYTEISEEGWHPAIAEEELAEVKNLKSIIDEYRGNNPHVGYGNYDDGEEYLNFYRQLFLGAIKEDNFRDIAYKCNSGELITGITSQGFDLTAYTDNKKCYYFYNKSEYNPSALGTMKKLAPTSTKLDYTSENMGYVTGSKQGIDVRGIDNDTNTIYSEPSILNVKNMKITFKTDSDEQKEYIIGTVMPYLMQMIPSTTIFECAFDGETPTPTKKKITISSTGDTVSSDGGTTNFTIKSNTGYTITSNESWLSADKAGGESGTTTVTVTCGKNSSTSERTGIISIDNNYKNFTIVQKGTTPTPIEEEIIISKNSFSVDSSAGNITFNISANTTYTVETSEKWIKSISPSSGSSGKKITFTVEYKENDSAETREGIIYVKGKTVKITQSGKEPYINVIPESKEVDCEAGNTTFTVSSNTNYVLNETEGWLSVSPSLGNYGEKEFKVTYDANTTTQEREGIINIGNNGKTFKLRQSGEEPKILTIAPESATVDNEEGRTTFEVNSTMDSYTVSSSASWVTVEPSGTITEKGIKTFTINYNKNTGNERSTTIKVGDKNFTLTQNKFVEPIIISDTATTVEYPSGYVTFKITANTDYDVKIISGTTWLSIKPEQGHYTKGDRRFEVDFVENDTDENRIGIIKIHDSVYFKLTQNKDFIKIDRTELLVGKEDGETSFNITAETKYKVTKDSDASNIISSYEPTSGNPSETAITVYYNKNKTIVPRTGKINVKYYDKSTISKVITITQQAGDKIVKLPETGSTVSNNEGQKNIIITANTGYNISVIKGNDWLSIEPYKGESGHTTLTLWYNEYKDYDNDRIGVIKIDEQTYTLTQQKKNKPIQLSIKNDFALSSATEVNSFIVTGYSYSIEASGDWFTYKEYTLSGSIKRYDITCNVNNNEDERVGTLKFTYEDYSVTYTLTQFGTKSIGNNVIYYTSLDETKIEPNEGSTFGKNVNMLSNEYHNGKGIMTFDNDVTEIGDRAFNGNGNIDIIIIPNTVEKIGEAAFGDCRKMRNTQLKNFLFPDSLKEIGNSAFGDCYNIQYVNLKNVITIGKYAFTHCSKLTDVFNCNNLQEIGRDAFSYCSELNYISSLRIVDTIWQYTFYYDNELTQIKLPQVKTICERGFNCCKKLGSIQLLNIEEIHRNAFDACDSLESIEIGNKITKIERYAFDSCKATEMTYKGNRVSFNQIDLEDKWNGNIKTVHCNDGDIYLE